MKNALIESKPFFDQQLNNKQEVYEKLIKMSRNDDYTIGNLFDYLYHPKKYKFIGIDLSRHTKMRYPQEINFTEKLLEDDSATTLKRFIAKKQQNAILNFCLDSLMVTE